MPRPRRVGAELSSCRSGNGTKKPARGNDASAARSVALASQTEPRVITVGYHSLLPTPQNSPARYYHLLIGIEVDRILAVRLEVAEERSFCPAEGEERHRRGDADVHANHAHADAIPKLPRRFAALREDRRRVRESRAPHRFDPFVQRADVRDRRDRPEDLFLADRHVGLHAIEYRRPDEMAARVLVHFRGAAVEQQRRAVLVPGLDVRQHALLVPRRHDRTHRHALVEAVAEPAPPNIDSGMLATARSMSASGITMM